MALSSLIAVFCALAYVYFDGTSAFDGVDGLVNTWWWPPKLTPWVSAAWNVGLSIIIAFLISYLSKAFNVLRSMTMLQGTLFLFLQLGSPSSFTALGSGTLMALTAVVCFYMFFSVYGLYDCCQRNVFMSFLLISAGSAIDASFILLMPVFIMASVQMRIFNMRTLLAIFMGAVTPWIIFVGFGLVDFAEIHLPPMSDFGLLSEGWVTVSAVIASFFGVFAWVQSIMKLLTYNARSRAMLSVITITMFLSIVAALLINAYSFLALLNCTVALMLGHTFGVVYNGRKSYLPILGIIFMYLVIFTWRLIV